MSVTSCISDLDLSLRMHARARGQRPGVTLIHHGGHAARKGLAHLRLFLRSGLRFSTRTAGAGFSRLPDALLSPPMAADKTDYQNQHMRPSQRKPDQLRTIAITPHFTRHAEGSVLIECGHTPRALHRECGKRRAGPQEGLGRGLGDGGYGMLPRSTPPVPP